ncbi:MAG: GNAT family N-acetyltransferase [bacterium]|nr:GNAT family N-acetyltransferase [bacterium]
MTEPDEFWESIDAFASKLNASPETCFVIKNGTAVTGYLITLPCTKDTLPALNSDRFSVPEDADTLYVHDLAMKPESVGKGEATKLVQHALNKAAEMGLTEACLIAVQSSSGYWSRFGFKVVDDLSPEFKAKLSSYGEDAVFMGMKIEQAAPDISLENETFEPRS